MSCLGSHSSERQSRAGTPADVMLFTTSLFIAFTVHCCAGSASASWPLRPSEDPTSFPSPVLHRRQQAWEVCSVWTTVCSVPCGATCSSSPPCPWGRTVRKWDTVRLNHLLPTHPPPPRPASCVLLSSEPETALISFRLRNAEETPTPSGF